MSKIETTCCWMNMLLDPVPRTTLKMSNISCSSSIWRSHLITLHTVAWETWKAFVMYLGVCEFSPVNPITPAPTEASVLVLVAQEEDNEKLQSPPPSKVSEAIEHLKASLRWLET
ncbi:uncharacterized protein LOC111088631 [Limulus polyphemus]|uniref:Uncharacterized protein LOC111088631 n=1 Tax=Limulus polyphemus TaxID=6850 RepID=A0ABM1TGL6_LIMPO|nr:uncharacterized protein LOC111088631 [Limulus polyphemus]